MSGDSTDPELQSSPALQAEYVAFTGTLASMTHREALDMVERHGGTAMQHISRQTTMLIIGEEGWPLEEDGQPSQKLRQAQELIMNGQAVKIVSESDWLKLLDLNEESSQVRKLYTPAVLCKLLGVSVGEIRQWERLGLIHAVRKVYRLPYFDYAEVTGARKLMELLKSGVSQQKLKTSLENLQEICPDINRPLGQLEMLADGRKVLYRDKASLIEPVSRQRYFDFDRAPRSNREPGEPDASASGLPRLQIENGEPDASASGLLQLSDHLGNHGADAPRSLVDAHGADAPRSLVDAHGADAPRSPSPVDDTADWSTAEWLQAGQEAAEEGHLEAAVQAFRLCLLENPHDPELHFHLAEALYRLGQAEAATERYYAAVECDHQYIEAWTQLGCVLEERGFAEEALSAFGVALELHPDFPDAHRHKAALLDKLNREDEAREHWETYLKHNQRGPWAEEARARLGDA